MSDEDSVDPAPGTPYCVVDIPLELMRLKGQHSEDCEFMRRKCIELDEADLAFSFGALKQQFDQIASCSDEHRLMHLRQELANLQAEYGLCQNPGNADSNATKRRYWICEAPRWERTRSGKVKYKRAQERALRKSKRRGDKQAQRKWVSATFTAQHRSSGKNLV